MKTTKSTEIETELNSTNKRIAELKTQLNEQSTAFETAQAAFVGGKASLDSLHAEQSKLTLVTQAIESLEAKRGELQIELQKATHDESQAEIMNRLKSIADEAEKEFANRETIRLEFDAVISKFAKSLFEASERLGAKAQDFRRKLKQLSPEYQKQARGVINSAAFSLLENGSRNSSNRFEFPDVINTTEMILLQQKHRTEQAERQAKFTAERAKNAAEIEAKRLEEKRIFDETLEAERKRISDYRTKNKMPILSKQEIDSYARENLARQNAQIAA